MENTPTPNSDFENLMKKHLQQADADPGADIWAQIAEKQRPRNTWLQFRHYGLFVVPAIIVLLLAVAGWWQYRQSIRTTPEEYRRIDPSRQPEHGAPAPVADALPSETPINIAAHGSGKQYAEKVFGARINTVPAETVRFRIEAGLHYQSPVTGTSVSIPAGSLRDANGRQVSGEAELLLREYRSIPDFLASGIPMHYNDERGAYFFNSGGMFEVRVVRQGEPLQMAPGQAYDIVFSPTDHLTKASLFYLDDVTATWRYQPDAAFVSQKNQAPPAQAPVTSAAQVLNDNKKRKNADCLPDLGEIPENADPAEFVKEAVMTGYNLATERMNMPVWFRKNPDLTIEQLLNGLERTLIRIVRHKDQNELFFPEDINKVFTELEAFKGCYFTRSADSLNGSRGATNLNTYKYWQRITVAQEKGANCQITLYGEQGWMQFYATLQRTTGNDDFDPDKIMAEYRLLRAKRQNDIETLVKKLRIFLMVAPAFQTREEWCMDAPGWLNYFNDNHALMAKRYAALLEEGLSVNDSLALTVWKTWRARLRGLYFDKQERNITTFKNANQSLEYALKLTNFGIHNYDQIFQIAGDREPAFIFAGYITPEGERVVPAAVSIMERSSRLFFTLPSADKMLRIPGRRLDVIVTDRYGRQYHLPAEKYAALSFNDNAQSNVFTVKDVTARTRTPREWAELLEM